MKRSRPRAATRKRQHDQILAHRRASFDIGA
jgi:hypothetical protein